MAGTPNEGEREFETGKDEAASSQNARITSNGVTFDKNVDAIMVRMLSAGALALENAVEAAKKVSASNITTNNMTDKSAATTNNLTDKQAVAHRDIAVDATWDPGPGEESLKKNDKK